MSDNYFSETKKTVAESDFNTSQPKKTVVESNVNRASQASFMRKDLLKGRTLGDPHRYLLQTLLGQGGMSKVYLALDTKFEDRVVAVKLMTNYASSNKQHLIKRFMGEVRAISRLKHPNIIQIFDFGVTPNQPPFYGVPFYVMEHLEGKNLQSWLSQKQISSNSILKIILQVAAGLRAAHDQNIIHRDLKPDNIFLIEGGTFGPIVKIIDFGIAKKISAEAENETQLTKVGSFIGTYRYASPEQCRGMPNIDRRSDIYSLGIILYEAICGKNPYSLQVDCNISQADWIACHLKVPPEPIKEQPGCEQIGDELAKLIMKCLAKFPEDRFSDLGELQQALASNIVVPQTQDNFVPLYDTKPIDGQKKDSSPSTTEVEAEQVPIKTEVETTPNDIPTKLPSKVDLATNFDCVSTNSANAKPNKFSLKFIASAITIAIAFLGTGGYLIYSRNTASNNSTPIALTDTSTVTNNITNNKNLSLAAKKLENQYQKQNYQECYQLALEHKDSHNALIQKWLGECGLAAAKIKADANSYSSAIALAQKIPQITPNYKEVQKNINTWSGDILDYATTVFMKGELEQAINVTKLVPENTSVKAKIPELISQWEQQQATHQATVAQAQNLLDRGRWSDAKQEVEKIPSDFVFWRAKAQPILDQANQKIADEIVAAEQYRREQAVKTAPIPLRERLKNVPLLNDSYVRRRLGTNP